MPLISHKIPDSQAERLDELAPRLVTRNNPGGAVELAPVSRSSLVRLGIEMVLHHLEHDLPVLDYLPEDAGEWDQRRAGLSLRQAALQLDGDGEPVAWPPLASEAVYEALMEHDWHRGDERPHDDELAALEQDAALLVPGSEVWIRGRLFTGGEVPTHVTGILEAVGATTARVLIPDEEAPVEYDKRDVVPGHYGGGDG